MTRLKQLVKTKLGFLQIKNKPTPEYLEKYYSNLYYQNEHGNYRIKYSKDEIRYFKTKNEQVYFVISKLSTFRDKRLLDIGCGEGFTLDFFRRKKWKVLGLDYSNYACLKMNPKCARSVITGDIYKNIDILIKTGKKFNIINMSNILEHVLQPLDLLQKIKHIAERNTVLIITVPNDFSFYQNYLLAKHVVERPFWVVIPDHISYFEKNSLKNICSFSGWHEEEIMSDFPIDIFLANKFSNYLNNRLKGRVAHNVMVKLENIFHKQSVEATIDMYKAMARLGFGRRITGFYKIKR